MVWSGENSQPVVSPLDCRKMKCASSILTFLGYANWFLSHLILGALTGKVAVPLGLLRTKASPAACCCPESVILQTYTRGSSWIETRKCLQLGSYTHTSPEEINKWTEEVWEDPWLIGEGLCLKTKRFGFFQMPRFQQQQQNNKAYKETGKHGPIQGTKLISRN